MSHRLRTILSILRKRRALRKREHWYPLALRLHQEQALGALRAHALAHSPFYAERHRGLEAAPLAELPPITKRELMARMCWCCQPRAVWGKCASTPWSYTRYWTRFAATAFRCTAQEAALKSWSPPNYRWTPLRSSGIFALPLRAQARLQARWWSGEWRPSLRERRASAP